MSGGAKYLEAWSLQVPERLATSSCPLHLRGEELLCPLAHFFGGEVLDMLGQPPVMSERIFQTPGPVAPELVGQRHDNLGAGGYRALPGLVHVIPVDEEADRGSAVGRRAPATMLRHFVAQHDQ